MCAEDMRKRVTMGGFERMCRRGTYLTKTGQCRCERTKRRIESKSSHATTTTATATRDISFSFPHHLSLLVFETQSDKG